MFPSEASEHRQDSVDVVASAASAEVYAEALRAADLAAAALAAAAAAAGGAWAAAAWALLTAVGVTGTRTVAVVSAVAAVALRKNSRYC